MVDCISTGLSAPTSSGLGITAATLSPAASYEIGQYFKSNDAEGSAAHILAHTVLGAAVAAAGGNDALIAGLSAGGAEVSAPLLSKYLYGKEAKDLTADEKGAVSAIAGLVASGVGATTGDIGSTLQSGQSAQNAVDNNASIAGAYAKKKSEQYNDLCKQSGISAGQCSEWTGQRLIGNAKELAMVFVPTEIYEVVPVGKGASIISKATGKVIAKFDDSKKAEKVLENIKVSKEGVIQENIGMWPPNSGGYARKPAETLKVGTIVDRYGYPGGSYVSPIGTPFEKRALPSSSLNKPYRQYEVIKPITPTAESKILPWFGQPGQGTQYKLPKSVQELLDPNNPYLKEIRNDKR